MIGLSRASFVLYQNQEEKQRKGLKFPCGQPVFIRAEGLIPRRSAS